MGAKFLFFALLFMLFSNTARADFNGCPDYADPDLTITSIFEEPLYDHTVTAADLKSGVISETPDRRIEALNMPVSNERARIGGMTRFGDVAFVPVDKLKAYKTPNGLVCVQIVSFALTIKTPSPTVYIASDFSLDSCSYNVLVEHELHHIAVAKEIFEKTSLEIKDQLPFFFRHLGVVQGKSVEEANAFISRSLNDYLAPLLKNLAVVLDKSRYSVDTPEEYQRVSKSCNGETQRIFNKSVRP